MCLCGQYPSRYQKADNSIRSTGGAVMVRNAKGELKVEKVKVKRYVAVGYLQDGCCVGHVLPAVDTSLAKLGLHTSF